jgi:hypothetical protein
VEWQGVNLIALIAPDRAGRTSSWVIDQRSAIIGSFDLYF